MTWVWLIAACVFGAFAAYYAADRNEYRAALNELAKSVNSAAGQIDVNNHEGAARTMRRALADEVVVRTQRYYEDRDRGW